jgi:hypothetical protein
MRTGFASDEWISGSHTLGGRPAFEPSKIQV